METCSRDGRHLQARRNLEEVRVSRRCCRCSSTAAVVTWPIPFRGAGNSWFSLVIGKTTYQDSRFNAVLVLVMLTRKRTQRDAYCLETSGGEPQHIT
jgi:hypothetical protein